MAMLDWVDDYDPTTSSTDAKPLLTGPPHQPCQPYNSPAYLMNRPLFVIPTVADYWNMTSFFAIDERFYLISLWPVPIL